ncbi:MAG: hypothetical protein K2Q12_06610 [Rickettsiales bacterium]|nr:hypothetical protein [Rickettsiales bacterium]
MTAVADALSFGFAFSQVSASASASLADSQLLAREAHAFVHGVRPPLQQSPNVRMVTQALERAAKHPEFSNLSPSKKMEAAIQLTQQFALYERLTLALESLQNNVGTATYQLLSNAFDTGFDALKCILDANCPQTRIMTETTMGHEILHVKGTSDVAGNA